MPTGYQHFVIKILEENIFFNSLYCVARFGFVPGEKRWQHSTMNKEQKFTQDEENTATTPVLRLRSVQFMFETPKATS